MALSVVVEVLAEVPFVLAELQLWNKTKVSCSISWGSSKHLIYFFFITLLFIFFFFLSFLFTLHALMLMLITEDRSLFSYFLVFGRLYC